MPNPYHDKMGRFTTKSGSGGSGRRLSGAVTYNSPGSATGSSGTYRNAGTGRRRTGQLKPSSPARDQKENRIMNRKSEKTYNKTISGSGTSRGVAASRSGKPSNRVGIGGASSRATYAALNDKGGKTYATRENNVLVGTRRSVASGIITPNGSKTVTPKMGNRVSAVTARQSGADSGLYGGNMTLNYKRQVTSTRRVGNVRKRVR